jgi:hypothetical protein
MNYPKHLLEQGARMETIIVYLDDADYAQQQLAPMKCHPDVRFGATHWVLVACAPRMTHRIGKWVSHGARERWRTQWAAKLFAVVQPVTAGGGNRVTTLLAKGPIASAHQSTDGRARQLPRAGCPPAEVRR